MKRTVHWTLIAAMLALPLQGLRSKAQAEDPPRPKLVTPKASESGGVVIEHAPVATAARGENLEVRATVAGGLGESRLYVMFRAPGEAGLRFVEMAPASGGGYAAQIPGWAVGEAGVEYYLRAVDSKDATTGRFPQEPDAFLSITTAAGAGVSPPARQPEAAPATAPRAAVPSPATEDKEEDGKGGTPWLWIGLAGAAVIGGAIALLAGGGDEDTTPPLDPLPEPPGHGSGAGGRP
jgi:hypothetical protein